MKKFLVVNMMVTDDMRASMRRQAEGETIEINVEMDVEGVFMPDGTEQTEAGGGLDGADIEVLTEDQYTASGYLNGWQMPPAEQRKVDSRLEDILNDVFGKVMPSGKMHHDGIDKPAPSQLMAEKAIDIETKLDAEEFQKFADAVLDEEPRLGSTLDDMEFIDCNCDECVEDRGDDIMDDETTIEDGGDSDPLDVTIRQLMMQQGIEVDRAKQSVVVDIQVIDGDYVG